MGTLKRALPATLVDLWWKGWADSLNMITRDTPNAAADRMTAPTLMGSWKGTKSVHPSGHCSGFHNGKLSTLTSRMG